MFVLFWLIWVVFNGRLTWEIAAFGVGISALLTWFCHAFLGYRFSQTLRAMKNLPKVFRYVGTLLSEIVKANLHVTKLVLSTKYEIEPRLVTFKTPVKGALAKSVLANSITLTPGTITALIEGDELTVHCLDSELEQGLDDTVFQRQLLEMEGTKNDG